MRLSHLCTSAVTAASLVGLAPPAFAGPSAPSLVQAAHAAAVVQQATGTTGIAPSTGSGADSAASATVAAPEGPVTVTTPATADGRVSVTAPNGSAVTLSFPGANDTAGTTSAAGTTVYPDVAPGTDLAVQATSDGGVRALVTLNDANAPTTQRFDLGLPAGATLAPSGAGGYDIDQAISGGGAIALGHIDAPWAKDAHGNAVPTGYHLDGTTLVQTVDTTATTAYPVVADPHYTWGYITGTIYYNRAETKWMRNKGNIIAMGSATAAAVGAIAGGPIGATVGAGFTAAWATYTATVAGNAYGDGQCLKIKLPTPTAGAYKGGYCK